MAQQLRKPDPAPTAAGLDDLVHLSKAVGDKLRAGILQVLHQESYSVSELCRLFEVPQPALSHHLKILREAGLVARRREGNSLFYRRATLTDPVAQAFLTALDRLPQGTALEARIEAIHAGRREHSQAFFASNASEIAARQAEISEPEVYVEAVMELLGATGSATPPSARVLEVGPGSGALLRRLAGRFATVTGIDSSSAMLDEARAATADLGNVRLEHKDMEALPRRRRYDVIVAAMVVHHQASPAGFFRHAAGLLRKSGVLVVAELTPHDQEWASSACGDQWLGFEPDDLHRWALRGGLTPAASQFLAQKNGFCIQVHGYRFEDRPESQRFKQSNSKRKARP